jgi:hypothetical protein
MTVCFESHEVSLHWQRFCQKMPATTTVAAALTLAALGDKWRHDTQHNNVQHNDT